MNDQGHEYKEGDIVEVYMPRGWFAGKVKKVHKNYAWSGNTHYEIAGKELTTIAPARVMRKPRD